MSEWIEWTGGKCPVKRGTMVQVQLRKDHHRDDSDRPVTAENMRWSWTPNDSDSQARRRVDIVAYRVVEAAEPPTTPEDAPATDKPSNPKDVVGIKKVPFSVISAAVTAEVGVGMLEGGCKYGRHNYRAVGVRASVYYDATMRHLTSWWEGEDIDPDSGLSHITKAICSLYVLRDAMINSNWEDDRAPSCPEFYSDLNKKVEAILERYKDRAPRHYTIADTRKV